MLMYNIGAYLTHLCQLYKFTNSTQVYTRGVLERTVLEPFSILAHIQPRKKSRDQEMQPNSDRVIGKITIFTLEQLNLTRQAEQATTVNYMSNNYFVTAERDWSDYGYFQYFGELIIPESTG